MIVPLLIVIVVILLIIAVLLAFFVMSMTTWQFKISEQLDRLYNMIANWH